MWLSREHRKKDLGRWHKLMVTCRSQLVILLHVLEEKLSLLKMIFTIFCFVAFVFFIPILLILFSLLFVYRYSMKLYIIYGEEGDVEISDVSAQTALETENDCLISNVIFILKGPPNIKHLKDFFKNFVDEKNRDGTLRNDNLQKILTQKKGFFIWKMQSDFSFEDQLQIAESHHRGMTVTERNVQEYISELCSNNLSSNLPPWKVIVIPGFSDNGVPKTWVILRVHYLLAPCFTLLHFPSSFPNPWIGISKTNRLAILSAPSAMSEVVLLIQNLFFNIVYKALSTLYNASFSWSITITLFNKYKQIRLWTQGLIHAYCELTWRTVCKLLLYYFYHFLLLLIELARNCLSIADIQEKTGSIYRIVIRFRSHKHIQLLMRAGTEIFWVTRAMISLPRLLTEEIIATNNAQSVHIWKKKRPNKWNRVIVGWSEEVSLGAALGIKGMTGASLSSILLTALAGAFRDLLRSSGAVTPDYLRCTLPIFTPSKLTNRGLLPLSLPVGAPDGQKALKLMTASLIQLQKYPERYVASIWITKYASKFIPQHLLRSLMIKLTETHPILFTNLVGPSHPSTLWDQTLLGIFYWRPPMHDAAISVCISSYCGKVSLGVLANGWKISNATDLTQSFVSHLNELAVDSGVKLQRQLSRDSFSRCSSSLTLPLSIHNQKCFRRSSMSLQMKLRRRKYEQRSSALRS